MKSFSNLGVLLAVGVTAFVATPRAFATAELILNDGNGHTATIVASSCGASCEVASFNGVLGDWNINVTTGTSAPGQTPEMDLNSINHHNLSATASTLTIEWSDSGFTPATPGFQLNIGGTVGAHGTVTAALYGGNSNTAFDLSNQIGTTMSFSNPPISFSGSQNAFMSGLSASPYSLTEVTTVSFGRAAGQASFDFSVDTVPEPSSVLMLGTVMLLTMGVICRKVAAGNKSA
jgi:hypothetical protein